MFGSGIITKPLKMIAMGRTQQGMGIQSPYLAGGIVRLGRFFYFTTGVWLGGVWYSAYVNERTAPGSGPQLVLPGKKVINGPDRQDKTPSFATALQSSAGVVAAGQGLVGTITGDITNSLVGGGKAGGFLPSNASYTPGRKDQGHDGSTNSGGPIIAPGAGFVVRIGSDPGGFGPNYPIVKFSTGPYAGRIIYIGHTHSALQAGQRFAMNQVLSYTGTVGVGNATVPGWFEIGFADSGSPGPVGQPTPF